MPSARRERKVRAHRDIGTPTHQTHTEEGRGAEQGRITKMDMPRPPLVGRIPTHRGHSAFALFHAIV